MTHFRRLYAWELRSLLRFPMLEVLVAFFVFQAFSLKSGMGSVTVDPTEGWRFPSDLLTFQSAQGGFANLEHLYLPVAVFTSIFAAAIFTHDFESGYLKVLLSHPVSRRSVFWAKCACIVSITLASLFLSLVLVVFSSNIHNADGLLDLRGMGRMWPAVVLVCLILSVALAGIAVLIATLSRNSAVTIAACIALFFVVYLAGDASQSPYLPPAALSRGDALLYVANLLPFDELYFGPIALSYSILGLGAGAAAYWLFVRRAEVT